MPDRIIAFVMAGGQGSRLQPLTSARSKPSVPFGSRYRLVDFVLSNLVNSQIRTIYLLVQYKSQSLIEHVRKAWTISPLLKDQFVTVVPPQMRYGESWFQGTADAVHQNINLIEEHAPDYVVVFGADHIYRMDIQQMVDFHKEREADVTIAALPVPIADAKGFGVIAADGEGRIEAFQEKPANPSPLPDDPNSAYASMGNYVFSAKVLIEALEAAQQAGETDFGGHVLPRCWRKVSGCSPTTSPATSSRASSPTRKRSTGATSAPSTPTSPPTRTSSAPSRPSTPSTRTGPSTPATTRGRWRGCSAPELDNALLGAASVVHENARLIQLHHPPRGRHRRGRRARGLHRHGLRARLQGFAAEARHHRPPQHHRARQRHRLRRGRGPRARLHRLRGRRHRGAGRQPRRVRARRRYGGGYSE
jgi:dTDP-glucose pyrophosphorylase